MSFSSIGLADTSGGLDSDLKNRLFSWQLCFCACSQFLHFCLSKRNHVCLHFTGGLLLSYLRTHSFFCRELIWFRLEEKKRPGWLRHLAYRLSWSWRLAFLIPLFWAWLSVKTRLIQARWDMKILVLKGQYSSWNFTGPFVFITQTKVAIGWFNL